jgi:hypothetical protein
LIKYQITVVTPSEIGLQSNLVMGEACEACTTFEIAIIKAIYSSEKKNQQLGSTTFHAMPYEDVWTSTTHANLESIHV